ncbi:MAG: hypothetical protein ICV68_14270, partial [Pyrinomonadaceae bacterium]|nr:hypothetical protein [Pyrinomonadaceae bacterium]
MMQRLNVPPVIILLMCALGLTSGLFWCACRRRTHDEPQKQAEVAQPTPTPIPVSDGFDYPVGRAGGRVTQAKEAEKAEEKK